MQPGSHPRGPELVANRVEEEEKKEKIEEEKMKKKVEKKRKGEWEKQTT